MPQTFVKDPEATLDYELDWSLWLDSDTIAASTWSVPDGITAEVSPAPSNTTTTTTIWLSGGTVGEYYRLTNHILTAAGREDDRTIKIAVRDK